MSTKHDISAKGVQGTQHNANVSRSLTNNRNSQTLDNNSFRTVETNRIDTTNSCNSIILINRLIVILITRRQDSTTLLLSDDLRHYFTNFKDAIHTVPPHLFNKRGR